MQEVVVSQEPVQYNVEISYTMKINLISSSKLSKIDHVLIQKIQGIKQH